MRQVQLQGQNEPSRAAGPTTEAVLEGPSPKSKTTGIVLRLHVNSAVQGITNTDQNAKLQGRNVSTVEDLDISQKCANRTQRTRTVARLRSST